MTRILIVAPVASSMHLGVERAVARDVLAPDTELVVRHIDGVPESVYVAPEEVFLPHLVAAVVEGERDGFDAIGISCCSDPGLSECRQAVSVPVSAPFEAVCSLLPALGQIGVLYLAIPPAAGESELTGEQWIPALSRQYGCADGIGPVLPVAAARPTVEFGDAGATPTAVGHALLATMGQAIDGAGVIRAREAAAVGARAAFPSCTYWSGLLHNIRHRVEIPVLDPLEELARHLERLAGAAVHPPQGARGPLSA